MGGRTRRTEGGGQGEVGEILGTGKLSESFKDMGFKGVRGEGECGPKSIKLMRWSAIGEGEAISAFSDSTYL